MINMLKPVTYKPLHSLESITAEMIEGLCHVKNSHNAELLVQAEAHGELLKLNIMKNDSLLNDDLLLVATEYILGHSTELKTVEVHNFNPDKKPGFLLQKYFFNQDGVIRFGRHQFFQLRGIWHKDRDYVLGIESWTTSSAERVHPVRPDIQTGTLYSKYIPQIEKTLSFRMIDPVRDLDIFHEWHNQPRVADFWELPLPKPELKSYIEKGLKDPHTLPMILECNGVATGYFEMYWCREDRLAPYYESEAFDRGFHFLIGDTSFLGFHNTDAAIKSLLHFLFIDEVRTRRVMAEPRSDNAKVLKYVETSGGWKKLYEFDFPHKRAALLECKREAFYMGHI